MKALKHHLAESTELENRRVADRIEVTWAVDCCTTDSFLYASTKNISASGIFISTHQPLPVGTRVSLRIALPDADESLRIEGHVQWINPVGSSTSSSPNPGMGIRFVALSDEQRERLSDAVKTIAYVRDEVLNSTN